MPSEFAAEFSSFGFWINVTDVSRLNEISDRLPDNRAGVDPALANYPK
ncbi:MAG: hypothetical protein ACR2OD_05560 [Gaiellaceae bacterium]